MKLNNQLLDNLTEVIGVHALLDSLIEKLDAKTAQDIVTTIMKENGLEVSNG